MISGRRTAPARRRRPTCDESRPHAAANSPASSARRDPANLAKRHVGPLIDHGVVEREFPDRINHPKQTNAPRARRRGLTVAAHRRVTDPGCAVRGRRSAPQTTASESRSATPRATRHRALRFGHRPRGRRGVRVAARQRALRRGPSAGLPRYALRGHGGRVPAEAGVPSPRVITRMGATRFAAPGVTCGAEGRCRDNRSALQAGALPRGWARRVGRSGSGTGGRSVVGPQAPGRWRYTT